MRLGIDDVNIYINYFRDDELSNGVWIIWDGGVWIYIFSNLNVLIDLFRMSGKVDLFLFYDY